MPDIFILSYADDAGDSYPLGPFSSLEKAQHYAEQDWDDIEIILPSTLRWTYSEIAEYWTTDEAERQWYIIKKFQLDKEFEAEE